MEAKAKRQGKPWGCPVPGCGFTGTTLGRAAHLRGHGYSSPLPTDEVLAGAAPLAGESLQDLAPASGETIPLSAVPSGSTVELNGEPFRVLGISRLNGQVKVQAADGVHTYHGGGTPVRVLEPS